LTVPVFDDDSKYVASWYEGQKGFDRIRGIGEKKERTLNSAELSVACQKQQYAELMACVFVKRGRNFVFDALFGIGMSSSMFLGSEQGYLYHQWSACYEMMAARKKIEKEEREIVLRLEALYLEKETQKKKCERACEVEIGKKKVEVTEFIVEYERLETVILDAPLPIGTGRAVNVDICGVTVTNITGETDVANIWKTPQEETHNLVLTARRMERENYFRQKNAGLHASVPKMLLKYMRPQITFSQEIPPSRDGEDEIRSNYSGDEEQLMTEIEKDRIDKCLVALPMNELSSSRHYDTTWDLHTVHPDKRLYRMLSCTWTDRYARKLSGVVVLDELGNTLMESSYRVESKTGKDYFRDCAYYLHSLHPVILAVFLHQDTQLEWAVKDERVGDLIMNIGVGDLDFTIKTRRREKVANATMMVAEAISLVLANFSLVDGDIVLSKNKCGGGTVFELYVRLVEMDLSYYKWLVLTRVRAFAVLVGARIFGLNVSQHLSVLGFWARSDMCCDITRLPMLLDGGKFPGLKSLRTQYCVKNVAECSAQEILWLDLSLLVYFMQRFKNFWDKKTFVSKVWTLDV